MLWTNISVIVSRKMNDNCYFAHCLFSFSLMLLITRSLLHFIFQFLIWNILKRTVENQEFYMKVLDTMILGGRFDHDHVEEEDRTIERQALRQTCKQKAVSNKSPGR